MFKSVVWMWRLVMPAGRGRGWKAIVGIGILMQYVGYMGKRKNAIGSDLYI